MRGILLAAIAAALLAGASSAAPPFSLKSSAFDNGGTIPAEYACADHATGVSPPLAWMGVPANTKELALLVNDPDAKGFTHLTTWGISPKAKGLARGKIGPKTGLNDAGKTGYLGPCPPAGESHTYVWTLYALKRKLNLARGAKPQAFKAAVRKAGVLKKAQHRGRYRRAGAAPGPPAPFALTSTAFGEGGAIPAKHTCDGQDTSPPLRWSGTPQGTKSLALTVVDIDAAGFVHWLTWGIGANVVGFEGRGGDFMGRNDFGANQYGGPCPPPPAGPHRYVFTLYALSTELTLPNGSTIAQLDGAIQGKVLGRATLTGTYDH